MSIRDEEIKQLIKYANGLKVKVQFKKGYRGCGGADWSWEPPTITIYEPQRSKTQVILNLLHELGHHMDWIYNDKLVKEDVIRAYEILNNTGVFVSDNKHIPKRFRKIILEEEKAAIEYMETLWKELDLGIPRWKVKLAQHLDLFEYKFFYKHGRFTTREEFAKEKIRSTPIIRRKYS